MYIQPTQISGALAGAMLYIWVLAASLTALVWVNLEQNQKANSGLLES
jgi:hypothetical protein